MMGVLATILTKGEPIPPLSPVTHAILQTLLVLGAIFALALAVRIAFPRRHR